MIVCQNKKALHDYFIYDKYECGIVLKGTEIKSIRLGHVSINDAYVGILKGEAFIYNMHVKAYDKGNIFNHDELRTRKLLLNKKEINKLNGKMTLEGYTLIPLKVYFKESLIKIEVAVCKGKKLYDKREDLKKKDSDMRLNKQLKNY